MKLALLLFIPLLGAQEIEPTIDPGLERQILTAQRNHHFENMMMLYAEKLMLKSSQGREYLRAMTKAEQTSEALQALVTVAEGICGQERKDFNRQAVACVDRPKPAIAKLLGKGETR